MLKDEILNVLGEFTMHFDWENPSVQLTTVELAKFFSVKRNTVSHYLNQLVEEKKVIKINTRPVYFLNRYVFINHYFYVENVQFNSIDALMLSKPKEQKKDVFEMLIGANGSFKKILEQIKASLLYPGNGLPIMLEGPTGSGKSMLAELMYHYSIENGILPKDAPFIVFNCAQYYNNPELLSSQLFGYKKGAFTGANQDQDGMLAAADGGILFLDEVHRLNEEGQEKLFTFMDKGVYRRMGESDGWRSANIRLIFATTEKPNEYFLNTFMRRVPITVSIAGLAERSADEKIQFIYTFFINEANKLAKPIEISQRVIDALSLYSFKGNIGELKNTIKYLCASAFAKQIGEDVLSIKTLDLPYEMIEGGHYSEKKYSKNKVVIIKPNTTLDQLFQQNHPQLQLIKQTFQQIYSLFMDKCKNKLEASTFEHHVLYEVNVLLDQLVFTLPNQDEKILLQFITNNIQEVFRYLENNYNITFNGNSVFVIGHYLYAKNSESFVWDEKTLQLEEELYEYVCNQMKEEKRLTSRLISLIESKIELNLTKSDVIFLAFYLKSLQVQSNSLPIKAIILAHGYATASSIANVVNRLVGKNIFDAFDMPIDISVSEIAENVLHYIEQNDVSNGLVILVDTGSLKDIYESFQKKVNGPIAIINNVSTQMALNVGDMLKDKVYLEDIVEQVKENNETKYKVIYPDTSKKMAIVTSCFTGMGTAIELKKLLEKSIPKELNIKIVAHDYERLCKQGTKEALFHMYDVLAIVGTADPKIKQVDFISLEELISGKGENKLFRLFSPRTENIDIQKINNAIIRNFSFEQVIQSLTILDTDKVIHHIEDSLIVLEVLLKRRLPNDKKLSLYVHMSCLIERLIRQTPIENHPNLKAFQQSESKELKPIQQAFSSLEKIYNVQINLAELMYIYDIISAYE